MGAVASACEKKTADDAYEILPGTDDNALEKTLLLKDTAKNPEMVEPVVELAKEEPEKPPETLVLEEKAEEPKNEENKPLDPVPEDVKPEVAPDQPKTEPDPEPTLMIEFNDGAKTVPITFSSKPLGMTYSNKAPFCVTTVSDTGLANQMGVKPTWKFEKIGGEVVTDKSFDEITTLLKAGAANLPSKG